MICAGCTGSITILVSVSMSASIAAMERTASFRYGELNGLAVHSRIALKRSSSRQNGGITCARTNS